MIFEEYDSQVLSRIGLTVLEAKIYLALVQTGKTTIKTISNASGVDRSDAYRAILKLQERGLVEQTIGFPNLYEAIPLGEGIKILMDQKKDEYHKIEQIADYLLQKRVFSAKENNEEKQVKFILIPQNHLLLGKIETELNKTQYSMDIITTAKRFPQIVDHFFTTLSYASQRGIKLRILAEDSKYEESISKKTKKLLTNPNFDVRFTSVSSYVSAWVFDKERATLVVDPTLSLEKSPAIWTNHIGLIAVLEEYFKRKWGKQKSQRLDPIAAISKV